MLQYTKLCYTDFMDQQSQQPNQSLNPTPFDGPKQGGHKKVKIALFVLVAVLVVIGAIFFIIFNKSVGINPVAYAQCDQLEQEIDTLVKQANYCEVDEDCVVSSEAVYPLCSCWSLVNKEVDTANLKEKRSEWEEAGCRRKDVVCEQCAQPPQILKCEQSRCVGTYYRPTTMQELKGYPELNKVMPELLNGHTVMVDGIYRWGFEDSNFGETADGYDIWVEMIADTEFENRPENFYGVEKSAPSRTAKVTIYGTFQTGNLERSLNFGHLGLWEHQIVADKIVFEETAIDENLVRIMTDKSTYRQGEVVRITAKNNYETTKWLEPYPYAIERFVGRSWVAVSQVNCPCGALCNAPPVTPLVPNEQVGFLWNQEEESCSTNFQLVSNVAPAGKYRVKVLVRNDINDEQTRETVYSEEFIIED